MVLSITKIGVVNIHIYIYVCVCVCVCVCVGTHIHPMPKDYIRKEFLEIEFLGHRVFIFSILVNTAKLFSKENE